MKNELSKRNKWYLPKHRYYELKHFVMQAPDWEKAIKNNQASIAHNYTHVMSGLGDITGNTAIRNLTYSDKIRLIKKAAVMSDQYLAIYILKGAINNKSYDYLRTKMNIPCSRGTYYDRYHKFFWILDKLQDYHGDTH